MKFVLYGASLNLLLFELVSLPIHSVVMDVTVDRMRLMNVFTIESSIALYIVSYVQLEIATGDVFERSQKVLGEWLIPLCSFLIMSETTVGVYIYEICAFFPLTNELQVVDMFCSS